MLWTKLFQQFNIKFTQKLSRGWTNVTCPFCDDHSKHLGFPDSFSLSDKQKPCTCFRCGKHNYRQALSKILSVPENEIDSLLSSYDFTVPESKTIITNSPITLPTDTFTDAEYSYLLNRGFDPLYLHSRYNISGGGTISKFKFRIIIPIYLNHTLVSFLGRAIYPEMSRYYNLSNAKSLANIKSTFFNLDNCNSNSVILTEGAFDVLRLSCYFPYDNALCSLGTKVTEKQIKLLSEKFDKVFVMFDNEPTAQNEAEIIADKLSSLGVEAYRFNPFPDFDVNDAGELSYSQVKQIRTFLKV